MEQPVNPNRNVFAVKNFLKEYLDLRKDKDNELATVDSIRKGVEFKGANLWILIFAIFMASLGLNVNSTAVIIGAMLISPLMGPIMGVGLSVGLNDFELMKRSLKSFLITTLFSVTTATVFFLVSPVAEGQSELLARTSPTIYDVFIALMGGLAGVVALSTKEKGNVIPGVAIATALMPPLCTAGYGLATGNLIYFLGAFYLYFINSVFISLATFIGVRVMHFQRKEFVDKNREKKVRKYIVLIAVLTMCPAVYLTVGIIQDTFFESAANRFVNEQLAFENTQVLDKKIHHEGKHHEIRVVLIGQEVPEASIAIARSKMKDYKLDNTKLVVLQGMNNESLDMSSIRAMVMEDFYKNSEQRLVEQKQQISSLEKDLEQYRKYDELGKKIIPELKVLYPSVKSVSISHALELTVDSVRIDTVTLAVLKFGCRNILLIARHGASVILKIDLTIKDSGFQSQSTVAQLDALRGLHLTGGSILHTNNDGRDLCITVDFDLIALRVRDGRAALGDGHGTVVLHGGKLIRARDCSAVLRDNGIRSNLAVIAAAGQHDVAVVVHVVGSRIVALATANGNRSRTALFDSRTGSQRDSGVVVRTLAGALDLRGGTLGDHNSCALANRHGRSAGRIADAAFFNRQSRIAGNTNCRSAFNHHHRRSLGISFLRDLEVYIAAIRGNDGHAAVIGCALDGAGPQIQGAAIVLNGSSSRLNRSAFAAHIRRTDVQCSAFCDGDQRLFIRTA